MKLFYRIIKEFQELRWFAWVLVLMALLVGGVLGICLHIRIHALRIDYLENGFSLEHAAGSLALTIQILQKLHLMQ